MTEPKHAKNMAHKELKFCPKNSKEIIPIIIFENLEITPPCHIWPSAVYLCHYICSAPELFREKSILELGSGTGLVGILTTKLNSKSTLTDIPKVLELTKHNIAYNDVDEKASIFSLPWGIVTEEMYQFPKFDLILASDVLFDSAEYENFFMTLYFFLELNPMSVAIIAYHVRSSNRNFSCDLMRWNMKASCIPFELDETKVDVNQFKNPSNLIELLEIRLNKS